MECTFAKSLLLRVLPARVKIKVLLVCFMAASAFGQWKPQKSNTAASLHGLSVVNASVVWASGTGGTFVRTTDGGETWQAGSVTGGEKLDFRNVYAVDDKTAYLMSIGNGNESRIYKTTDAGKTWSLQYTEQNPKAFLDCMAFWTGRRCGRNHCLRRRTAKARRPPGHASRLILRRKEKTKPGTLGS